MIIWATAALLYFQRRPEKLSGMSARNFRLLCFALIGIGILTLLAAPFVRK